MKDNNSEKLIDFIENFALVDGEMIKNNGEDCFMYSIKDNYGILAVFDGCGGIGSRKYEEFGSKTGAYIASRVIASATNDWFNDFSQKDADLTNHTLEEMCKQLHVRYDAELAKLESNASSSAMKGSLTKSFPTTASIIVFKRKGDKMLAAYIWAGDSRGFVLTPERGLSQITKDDIDESEDAMSNLSSDGRLTNVISAKGDYKMNGAGIALENPSILITATDGCFGYFSTPMEVEYMLLETIAESNNMIEWETKLKKYILKFTGDDHTLVALPFGYGSFKALKKAFAERKKYLYKNFIMKLEDATDMKKNRLWEKYKTNYYRGV